MPDIGMRLGAEVLVVDGAFGTMLQRYEVPSEQCPEELNITAPEMIAQIHHDYVFAGAECVTTNSFGGSRAKLAEYGLADRVAEFNRAAVALARASGAQHVLADVGPTGLVMEPLGDATFDEVFEIFAEQVAALVSAGPDAIMIETMTDIAEARCAVLAARSVCDLPVFATCTFGSGGRMDLSGTDPATAAVILQAAGANAVGMNCGLGPEQMLPLVVAMSAATTLPIIVQPNAGLPRLESGVTVFPGTPDEMGEHAARFVELGASLVGSCCGSSPAFTGAILDFAKGRPVRSDRVVPPGVVLAGPRGVVRIGAGSPIAVIGERINPTGKPALADSLRAGSMSVVRTFAAEQAQAGAHALDVNVGAAGVDQVDMLAAAVTALAGSTDLPLVIDNTDPEALEAALRLYPGRALVNSVNGSDESLAGILPLAARYGAAVIVLALDDDGIPHDAEGRLAIIERVRKAAIGQGMTDEDLVVDALVMTAATDASAPRTTVETLTRASLSGLATILGVSNVSHGLPDRALLNAAFVAAAAAGGLDAGIINPGDHVVMEAVRLADNARSSAVSADAHEDVWAAWDSAYENALARARGGAPDADGEVAGADDRPVDLRLASAVERGDSDGAPALVDALVRDGVAPDAIIRDVLTPAIQRLGDAFGRGEVYLPQLMVAAEAMKVAVAQVKSYLPDDHVASEGRVVFATVKGDIHSIGKDICVSLLESQGFEVEDLGVDVEPETIVQAASSADAVCLSALMTTTLPAMARAVALLAEERPGIPAFVGGAVVTGEWAASIGAGYSDDAPGCVRAVREALAGERSSR